MAILGTQGFLRLRRDPPSAQVFTPESISENANAFRSVNNGFWTGDEVRVFGPLGIPIAPDAIPDGSGMYVGGRWATGPNRAHISGASTGGTSPLTTLSGDQIVTLSGDPLIAQELNISTPDDDRFWLGPAEEAPGPPEGDPALGDAAWFYAFGDPITSGTFYVYVDQLGRITLYNTRREAFFGSKSNRVPLFVLNFGILTISPAGTEDYDNAVASCVDRAFSLSVPDVVDGQTLESICDFAPTYEQPIAGVGDYNNADLQPRNRIDSQFPWEFVCEMKSWSLETDGAAVDTTCLGNKWGENIKSLVTGGGQIDFMVDRLYENDESRDSTALMRLALLTEKGSKADAEFFLIVNRPDEGTKSGRLPGDLFYEASLLVTSMAISVRAGADEAVVGSARFVTTGPIELREGPN